MAKTAKKTIAKKLGDKPLQPKIKATLKKKQAAALLPRALVAVGVAAGPGGEVLDRLHDVVATRKGADPSVSHSARLLSRGTAKIAQKFGEEAVECLIEAVRGDKHALIGESADVLYHLMVLWVDAGVAPAEVWAELQRREGVSGIAEKAARPARLAIAAQVRTRKIP
jgi:phosphoribosyl-ATP pyrophosphohydrolase